MAGNRVFEVAVHPEAGSSDSFTVEVVESQAGQHRARIRLDLEPLLDRARPRALVGRELFRAVLGTGPLNALYRSALALAEMQEAALRLVIRCDDPRLLLLPWEAMTDPDGGSLALRGPLVRSLPVAAAVRPLPVRPPLRILAISAVPHDVPLAAADRERELLDAALAELRARGAVEVHWLTQATWTTLQRALLTGPWHVVHFIGHGSFDPDLDQGTLALVDERGGPAPVEATRLVHLLRLARPTPRLMTLNCCLGARGSTTDAFTGVAAALVRAGVCAVAAMQDPITDWAATRFAHGFYSALALGHDVDDAVSSGRLAILGEGADTEEWMTPVVFLRGADGRLFDVTVDLTRVRADADADAASEVSESTGDTEPARAARYYRQGRRLLEAEHPRAAAAAEAFRAAITADPGSAQSFLGLGLALRRLGRPAQAEAALRRAVELWPSLASGHRALGDLLAELGREYEAAEHYRTAERCTGQDAASPDAGGHRPRSRHRRAP